MDDAEYSLKGLGEQVLVVVVPAGVTHETAADLRVCVASNTPNQDGAAVVLDMSDVVMISSLGVTTLLQIRESCTDRGCPFILAAVPPAQMSFFDMLKIAGLFTFAQDAHSAVATLDAD